MLNDADRAAIMDSSVGGKPRHNPDDPAKTMSIRLKGSHKSAMDKLREKNPGMSYGGIIRLALVKFLVGQGVL